MKIAVVGTGYVGLVTGACFADMGVDVVCVDINKEKIDNLNKGIIPIYEPGLEEIVLKNSKAERLTFSTDLKESLDSVDVVFCAVGTPSNEDGSADLHYVLDVAREVGEIMNSYVLFVTKSTVPVGTVYKVKNTIKEELDRRGINIEFDVASNPEFLKEGDAVTDFMRPDRVVVGVENDRARQIMTELYKPFMLNKMRIIFTDVLSSEMIKYASNAMLATRISFMNEIAALCDKVGADVNMVRVGMGSDHRIGTKFLYAGTGYGGSCFPKDVRALINTAKQNDIDMKVLKAVEEVNDNQKRVLFDMLSSYYKGDLKGKTIAIWGLAFKPETDDVREAPALVVIDLLIKAGCNVKAYDPVAMEEIEKIIGDKIAYVNNLYSAAEDADAVLLLTEWKEFRMPNWDRVKNALKGKLILDGRNIYEISIMEKYGFHYGSIGSKKIGF